MPFPAVVTFRCHVPLSRSVGGVIDLAGSLKGGEYTRIVWGNKDMSRGEGERGIRCKVALMLLNCSMQS